VSLRTTGERVELLERVGWAHAMRSDSALIDSVNDPPLRAFRWCVRPPALPFLTPPHQWAPRPCCLCDLSRGCFGRALDADAFTTLALRLEPASKEAWVNRARARYDTSHQTFRRICAPSGCALDRLGVCVCHIGVCRFNLVRMEIRRTPLNQLTSKYREPFVNTPGASMGAHQWYAAKRRRCRGVTTATWLATDCDESRHGFRSPLVVAPVATLVLGFV
jgi:hypothetical protein